MNTSTKPSTKRPLKLERETLRQLSSADLTLVVGGLDRQQPFRSMGCQL